MTEKILPFKTAADFRKWLAKNFAGSEGIWLRLFKKDSGVPSLNYAQALDEALCYGWIDAQKKSFDDQSWIQRFCPRRAQSKWSKINRDHVERLIKAKKMRAPGLAAVRAAKADGRWDAAYDSPSNSSLPKELEAALKKNKKAREFFATLNRANVYAITYRIQTAKKIETRQRWVERIIKMLEQKKKFHE